jgi:hypothetical protein
LLGLNNKWFAGKAVYFDGPLGIKDAAEPIASGMSGSPILDTDGAALGLVSSDEKNPRLACHLPGWALTEFGTVALRRPGQEGGSNG